MITWLKTQLRKLWPIGARAPQPDFDADLGEVFLAELGDVTQALSAACASWRANPRDPDALMRLRRGFHTLKGSAPLIGATALGEFCALIEHVTTRLIEAPAKITPDAISTLEQAVAVLPAFAQSIRDARPPPPLRTLTARVRRIPL